MHDVATALAYDKSMILQDIMEIIEFEVKFVDFIEFLQSFYIHCLNYIDF